MEKANLKLTQLSLVVTDYDQAIAYYTQILGFYLVEDVQLTPEKRWVVVSPSENEGAKILLAKAGNALQAEHIGNQTGGRVFLFLETDNFDQTYANYCQQGVEFIETPRTETYAKVVVFKDLYGNKWDLIGRY